MARENPDFIADKKQLRTLIKDYEKSNWSYRSDISVKQIADSDLSEVIVEREEVFLKETPRHN